jgi:hypothetical protein
MSPSNPKDAVPLFFAFPDGVFHHVCAECNALCCRGGGFGGSMKREMPFLLKRYPALSTAVTGCAGDVLHLTNPVDRCFFLNDNNLCQIEVEHGKRKKPGVCTVFPFNCFRRIGQAVAVTPHFACPLRLQLPAKPGEVEGTHKTLKQAIRNSRLLEADYVGAQMPDTRLHRTETPPSVLAREKRFRDVCANALGRAPFRDVLMAESKDPKSLEKRVWRAVNLMRWEPSKIRGLHKLDDMLLAMASALRMEALHLSSEDILASLLMAERAALQACAIANHPPSPQGVYAILQGLGPAIRLLAYGESFPSIPRSINKSPFGVCELSFHYTVALARIPKEGTLKALEKTFKDGVSPADRKLIVHQLGFQLERTG